MKFFAGFMTGVVVTLLGVLFWLKKDVAPADAVANETYEEGAMDASGGMPADFNEFLERFHTDSVYQLAHITFPLEGFPANADSAVLSSNQFRWQAADWVMHRPFNDMDGQFERKFVPMGSEFVIEQIKGVQGQYGMQRRFSRRDDGWHLIYYAGMNKLQVKETEN